MHATPEQETLDQKVIHQLQELDRITGRGTLNKIIQLFLSSMPERLDALQRALATSDYAEIRKLTHTMKASAGNLGARRLSEYCRQMEEMDETSLSAKAAGIIREAQAEFEKVKALLLASLTSSTP